MRAPASDLDLYTTEALLRPYDNYRVLRDLGPVVWLNSLNMFVLPRYEEVKAALGNPAVFSSAGGIALNDDMNEKLRGGLLCSDAPRHEVLRKVIERPLMPGQLSKLRKRVSDEAEELIDRLVAQKEFDAATELAQYLPLTIVSDLVGLPEDGRDQMLVWAAANFDCLGPADSPRTIAAFPIVAEMIEYAFKQCVPGKLKRDGWAQMIWDAADRGEISVGDCPHLMNDYMGPSLDTTIFATTSAIWLFAQNPDQWRVLRSKPHLIPSAINEAVRIESPIPGFSRFLAAEHVVGDITLPAGSRAIVLYASANRDERHWDDPEAFDITRKNSAEHLGFGFGEHRCVGSNLARLEIAALLTALAKRVERFEILDLKRGVNNMLRSIERCIVRVH